MGQPHFIVFANEKGGTGKSTTAVHTAIALAASGHRVAALDLDSRQRTMTRYLENRDATIRRLSTKTCRRRATKCSTTRASRRSTPPSTACRAMPTSSSSIRRAATTPIARAAILKADTLVTPMNDSFVDLDLIGQVHPGKFQGHQAELLRRADLEQPHPARQGHRQERRLGRAPQPPAAHRIAQSSPRRRSARRAGQARRLPSHPRPWRAGHLPRAVPQGPDPARLAAIRRSRHRPYRRPPGASRDDRRALASPMPGDEQKARCRGLNHRPPRYVREPR